MVLTTYPHSSQNTVMDSGTDTQPLTQSDNGEVKMLPGTSWLVLQTRNNMPMLASETEHSLFGKDKATIISPLAT